MPISALLFLLLLAPQDQLDEKIKSLITALKSEDIETREKATKELMTLEVAALPTLEKAQAVAEGEVRARLELAVTRLRREVKLLKKAPTVRLVTVSAKNQPLMAFLEEVGRQSGVACESDPAVSKLTVTIEAKDEPLLKVLDRACTARTGMTFEISKGRLRVNPGNHPGVPTAYAGPFRARLMKTAAPGAKDSILYFRFDAQPDQEYLSVSGCGASSPAGIAIEPASQIPFTIWNWTSATGKTVQLAGIDVQAENWKDLAGVFLVKRDDGAAATLGALRFRARFQFPIDAVQTVAAMTEPPRKLSVGDYEFNFHGAKLYVERPDPLPKLPRPGLDELTDLDSYVAFDPEGKKYPLKMFGTRVPFPGEFIYQFTAGEDLKGRTVKLEYTVYTLADREIEFELKDVKLRP